MTYFRTQWPIRAMLPRTSRVEHTWQLWWQVRRRPVHLSTSQRSRMNRQPRSRTSSPRQTLFVIQIIVGQKITWLHVLAYFFLNLLNLRPDPLKLSAVVFSGTDYVGFALRLLALKPLAQGIANRFRLSFSSQLNEFTDKAGGFRILDIQLWSAHGRIPFDLSTINATAAKIQAFSGMAMRRPAPSGIGKVACAAFMRSRRAATSGGKAAVFLASISTCNAMFSDVAESQFSSA